MSDGPYATYLLMWLALVVASSAFRFREIGWSRTLGLALIWAAIFLGGYLVARWLGYDA